MSELKRCPFCGASMEETAWKWKHPMTWYCVLSGFVFTKHTRDVGLWNTRKPVDDVVEALEGAARLEITVHGGRCNGKTLTLGYAKGIESAIEIIKEKLNE